MMTEFSPATEDVVDAFVCGGDTTHERLAAALRALGSRIHGAPEIREAIFEIGGKRKARKKKSQKTANITNIIKNIYINPYYYWVLGLS